MLATLIVIGSLAMIGTSVVTGHDRDRDNALTARLNGENEVPPADEDGRGKAKFKIDVDDGELCFRVRFDNITTPNRGHIHGPAPKGTNAGILITLFDMPTDADTQDALERGRLSDCVDVADEALLQAIKDNPENYYINLHNTRYPAGAIRGQLKGDRGHHDDD
jgi:hypothetical protein